MSKAPKSPIAEARELFVKSNRIRDKRIYVGATLSAEEDTASLSADRDFYLDVTKQFLEFVDYAESLERKVEELEKRDD